MTNSLKKKHIHLLVLDFQQQSALKPAKNTLDKILKICAESARFTYQVELIANPLLESDKIINNKADIILVNCAFVEAASFSFIEKAIDKGLSTPIILLTHRDYPLDEEKLLSLGASEQVVEDDLSQAVLDMMVKYAILLRNKETKLDFESSHDYLTKIPNRRFFQFKIQELINHKTPFSIVMLDLDGFKRINDTLGYHIGDLLLKQVTERLSKIIRPIDYLARLGGDEFGILIPRLNNKNENPEQISNIISQMLNLPFNLKGQEFFTGVSIGISMYPDDSIDVKKILYFAESALHVAKSKGKGHFEFYAKSFQTHSQRVLRLQNDLRRAIQRNEFLLYFHTQIDAATDQIIGLEVLVRWEHPEFGFVTPNEFIPIAEESGLIALIGQWIMVTACKTFAKWKQEGLVQFKLGINVSVKQFLAPNFVEFCKRVVQENGITAKEIQLEITESIFIENAEKILAMLSELKKLGFEIVMDDFGTGYSCLSYLEKLPIDGVKIDRSFIEGMQDNQTRLAIVKSIIDLAKNMDLAILAEGVELEVQKKLLLNMGCRYQQGYLYGRPMSTKLMTEHLMDIKKGKRGQAQDLS